MLTSVLLLNVSNSSVMSGQVDKRLSYEYYVDKNVINFILIYFIKSQNSFSIKFYIYLNI